MDKFVIKKRKHGDSGEGEEGNESRSASEKDLVISTVNKSTSKKSRKNRSYLDNYLDLGFFWCGDEVNPTPLCVICGDKLAYEAMVPSKLKRHLSLKHGHLANKPRSYFEGLLNEQKQQRVMLSKTVKVSDKAQEASYLVAELVAKSMEPHTIAETLILPACSAIVKTMFGSEAEKQVKKIPVSDSTISRRIHMSADIEETVCASVKESEMFALQVDESTDIGAKAMAEDNPVDTPKRKRGRPPKPDSEKATTKRKAESDSSSPAKRGRGRPKGSKNKGSVAAKKPASKGTGKRGRPPKNPPKEDASEESAEDAE